MKNPILRNLPAIPMGPFGERASPTARSVPTKFATSCFLLSGVLAAYTSDMKKAQAHRHCHSAQRWRLNLRSQGNSLEGRSGVLFRRSADSYMSNNQSALGEHLLFGNSKDETLFGVSEFEREDKQVI